MVGVQRLGARQHQGDVVGRVLAAAGRRAPCRSGPRGWPAGRSAPAAAGRCRGPSRGRVASTRPSVYRARRLPSGSSSSVVSKGRPPTPEHRADADVHHRVGAVRQDEDGRGVAGAGDHAACARPGRRRRTGRSRRSLRRRCGRRRRRRRRGAVTRSSRCVRSSSGGRSTSASVCTAVRSRPMVAEAWMPWPTTSPTTRPTRAPESGMTSNQSPPTPAREPVGR